MFELLAKLIGQTDLSVLKLFWFGVEALLPGELACEAIAEPDV